jgi:hypothetical protein
VRGINLTIPIWLEVCLISVPCGVVFGLTLKSNAELIKEYQDNISKQTGGFKAFTRILVNLIIMLGTFFVPSFVLLEIFHLFPLHNNYIVWGLSIWCGAIVGKIFRWWRWSKTCDFG